MFFKTKSLLNFRDNPPEWYTETTKWIFRLLKKLAWIKIGWFISCVRNLLSPPLRFYAPLFIFLRALILKCMRVQDVRIIYVASVINELVMKFVLHVFRTFHQASMTSNYFLDLICPWWEKGEKKSIFETRLTSFTVTTASEEWRLIIIIINS